MNDPESLLVSTELSGNFGGRDNLEDRICSGSTPASLRDEIPLGQSLEVVHAQPLPCGGSTRIRLMPFVMGIP